MLDGGRLLLGGSPLRLLRLSPRAAAVVAALTSGAPVGEAGEGPAAVERLVRRLLDGGLAHPRPGAAPYGPAEVTVVIPARDRAEPLAATLAALGDVGAVVVVDDGSKDATGDVARAVGARVVRRAMAGGPAAARNAGAAIVATPVIVFVDSDCAPQPGWLGPLLAHLADPQVGAAAPRVRAAGDGGALAHYEAVRSPLDLGASEAAVRPRTRVSYVPTATLVVRTEAFLAVGGFDEGMPTGEDVDFVWRLAAAGWSTRYEPLASVTHARPDTLLAFARRRADYGSAAAPLARRHPGTLPPVAVSAWSALSWALAASGQPLAGTTVAAATTAALARRLEGVPSPWREAARLAGTGHWRAGRQLADAVTRAWLPVALIAALRSKRARRVLLAALVLPALAEWRERRPALDPLRFAALRALDDASYCAGVWRGCVRELTVEPLVPDLRSWPGRRSPVEQVATGRRETEGDAPGAP